MSFFATHNLDNSNPDGVENYLKRFRGFGALSPKFPPHPFVGLRSYSREDAPLFLGRDKELAILEEFLKQDPNYRIFLLWGSGDIGKSSFLQAGLLGRLPEDYRGLYLRLGEVNGLDSLLEVSQKQLEKWGKKQQVVWILDQWEELLATPFARLDSYIQKIGKLLEDYPLTRLVVCTSAEFRIALEEKLSLLPQKIQSEQLLPLTRQNFEQLCDSYKQGILHRFYPLSFEEGLQKSIIEQVAELPPSWRAPRFQLLMSLLWEEASKVEGKRLLTTHSFGQVVRKSFPLPYFEYRLQELFSPDSFEDWVQLEAHLEELESGLNPRTYQVLCQKGPQWVHQLEGLGLIYRLETPYQQIVLPLDSRLLPWVKEKQKQLLKPVPLGKQVNSSEWPSTANEPSFDSDTLDLQHAKLSQTSLSRSFPLAIGLILLGLLLGWISLGLISNLGKSTDGETIPYRPRPSSSFPIVKLPGDGSLPGDDTLVLHTLVKPHREDSKLSLHRSSPSFLNGLLPKAKNQEIISFTLENTSRFQFPLSEFSIWLKGEQTQEIINESDFELIQYDSLLHPHHLAHYQFRIKQDRPLAPDAYRGGITLYFPSPVAPVELDLTVYSRMSAIWAILILFLGIIVGRMIRGVSENEAIFARMDRVVHLRSQLSTLTDPLSKSLLSEELRLIEKTLELSKESESLEELDHTLTRVEQKVELLEQVDRLQLKLLSSLQNKGAPVIVNIQEKLESLRRAIFLGEQAELDRQLASLNRELLEQFSSDNSRSIFSSKETLASYQVELGKMTAMVELEKVSPNPPKINKLSGENALATWVSFISGVGVSTQVRYWFFRPLITLLVFVLILLLGFDEIYLKGANTFGSDGLFDILKLFLWGAVSDVFSRNLGENKAIVNFLK